MYYFVQPQSTFSFSWLFNFLGRTIKNNFYLDVFPVFITNIFYLPRYLIFILFSVYTILLIFCLFTFQQYTAMVMQFANISASWLKRFAYILLTSVVSFSKPDKHKRYFQKQLSLFGKLARPSLITNPFLPTFPQAKLN